MKVRIALLISVLSHVADSTDASEARSLILQWILDEAERTGGNKHRIRRNLIWSNHVRGSSATDKFASLVWDAAANQTHEPLITTVRAKGDEQALRDHLSSLAPQTTLSARWVEKQVLENDLDRKLTKYLLRRSRMEYNELRSLVGHWLGKWGVDGTFDTVLAEEGTVHIRVLMGFLRGKIRSHHFRRGTEPLERRYGARTENEIVNRRRTGDSKWITSGAERVDNDSYETALVFDDESTAIGVEFIDSAESPEDAAIRRLDTERQMKMLRAHTRINHGSAGERFTRVLGLMAQGMTTEQVAVAEGVSDGRAKKLTNEVRAGLRKSVSRNLVADAIIRTVSDEPFSTRSEIEETLQIESDVVDFCLRYLVDEGEITEFSGQSYVLTRNL